MIPLKLELHNFLSYGPTTQVVDFKEYGLICLSGKNGHGKSALLDAMTWALWGQARKVTGSSRADEGLLHLGQSRMMVSMEFLIADARYRVRREFYVMRGKSTLVLDIELYDHAQERFIPLTDKTIRCTQEKLDQVIGLDYQTFVNSAFLRQGLSNEFSQKNPKERKNILANILNLSRFDALKAHTLELSKQLTEEKKLLFGLREQALSELAQEAVLQERLVLKQVELEQSTVALATQQALLDDLVAQKLKQVQLLQQQQHQESLVTQVRKTYELTVAKWHELVRQWRMVHHEALAAQQGGDLLAEQEALYARDRDLVQRQALAMNSKEALLAAQAAHQAACAQRTHELLMHKQTLQLSEQKAVLDEQQAAHVRAQLDGASKELEHKKNELVARVATLDNAAVQLPRQHMLVQQMSAQLEKRKAFYQTYTQHGKWARERLSEVQHKQQLAHETDNPSCPLCEQVLTVKRKDFLAQKFAQQQVLLQHRVARLLHMLSMLKSLIVAQQEALDIAMNELTALQHAQGQREQITTQLAELHQQQARIATDVVSAEQAMVRATECRVALAAQVLLFEESLEAQVQQDARVIASAAAVEQAQQLVVQHAYDSTAHEQLRVQLKQLEERFVRLRTIEQERAQQEARRERIREHVRVIREVRLQQRELEATLLDAQVLIAQSAQIDQAGKAAKEHVAVLAHQKELVLQELSSIQTSLDRLVKVQQEQQERDAKIAVLDEQIDDYQALSMMFGKDGLQALLIEEAIPEIEEEANKLLSRLSDNRAQIFIESLRDLKKGGVKETLDIRIADSAGIRPYEMYSGGEAFRIDFALRIAISKLLARRAGTSLQTLIIDEGFGSQDEEGLARLMDALYAIQEDFARVIVVSHLPVFKENFPVHLLVEKYAQGSRVSVLERG